MDSKNPNKLYEVYQKIKRNNVYTNIGLHNGTENLKYFSLNRPLSAEEPYQNTRRSPHNYLRSKQKSQRSPKPMKIGKANPSAEQNINLYFDKRQYEQKAKSQQKPKFKHQKSSEKNIYVSKNINTSYGRGVFRGNYQKLFMEFTYQGERKSNQKEFQKDLYTKYKTRPTFKPSGKALKTVENQNLNIHKYISEPYKPLNEQYMFRAKSPTSKFLNRFQWKPTTQFISKKQH